MTSRAGATTGYVPELDGLRGIAILLVMIHRLYPHSAAGTPWPIEAGWIGVDLFFVISGFLIAGILLDTRGDADYFRNFYARRVLRIFPLFYLLVGGMLLASKLLHHTAFLDAAGSPAWYLLQLGNIPEALLGKDPPYWLAPVWSLAIEEQFYLTFPLVVRFTDPARLGRVLFGVAVFALATRLATTALLPERERVQYLFTLCRLDTIAVGCGLAVIVRSPRYAAWRDRLARPLILVASVAFAIAMLTQLDRTTWFGRTFGYSVVAIGFGALVLRIIEHRPSATLTLAPLRYLGKLCFGLYLLHRPADTIVSALTARAGLDGARLLWLPVKIAVAVVLATVSWRVLEQPFLRLKDRFASRHHPMVRPAVIAASLVVLASLAGCDGARAVPLDGELADAGVDARAIDARAIATDAALDAPPPPPDDASTPPPPPPGRVVYSEGAVLSPITQDLAAGLAHIVAQGTSHDDVFAKIGDSITASASFASCFDGGVELGGHGELDDSLAFFRAGDAAGASPFGRASLAAKGGWQTSDVVAGPLDQELTALAPRAGLVLLGTNDARYGRSLAAFTRDLWTIVDAMRARGVVPILSTMPAMHGDPDGNNRTSLFNRAIRALAQGRAVPLIDLRRALDALANDGLSDDGLHPSVAPAGACVLSSSGLAYGYNTRNLLSLQALDRVRRACHGDVLDNSAPRRAGRGSHAEPYRGSLPIADMIDTRAGELGLDGYACGVAASGREIVYRVDLAAATTLDAYVVAQAPVDVQIAILDGALAPSACVAGGALTASAKVGPGPVYIVLDSAAVTTEGEAVLVVQARD